MVAVIAYPVRGGGHVVSLGDCRRAVNHAYRDAADRLEALADQAKTRGGYLPSGEMRKLARELRAEQTS